MFGHSALEPICNGFHSNHALLVDRALSCEKVRSVNPVSADPEGSLLGMGVLGSQTPKPR